MEHPLGPQKKCEFSKCFKKTELSLKTVSVSRNSGLKQHCFSNTVVHQTQPRLFMKEFAYILESTNVWIQL